MRRATGSSLRAPFWGCVALVCLTVCGTPALSQGTPAEGAAVEGQPAVPEGRTPRYRHKAHAERFNVQDKCTLCHASAANGRVEWPGAKTHQPCVACHTEFRTPPATGAGPGVARFCETCHGHSEPWRANPTRVAFSTDSEFTVRFAHDLKAHRTAPCAKCHPSQSGAQAAAAPAGHLAPSHRLCADCHQALAKPAMPECGGCHVLGGAGGEAEAGGAWRVGHRFDHAGHRADVRQAPRRADAAADAIGWAGFDQAKAPVTPCTTCHAAQAGELGRPGMAVCATCHEGAHAFKVTGFDCRRCHLAPEHAAPAHAARGLAP